MRRLERRAFISLLLAAVLFIGLLVFVYRFITHGGEWATFYGNQSLYSGDALSSGSIYDRDGTLLVANTEEGTYYNEDYNIRRGTLHAVGDTKGNISTSAMVAYRDKLIGYNLVTGTYKLKGKNEDIDLTIDADACSIAYQWLSYYDGGSVGVYNYKTGEILCLASAPGFDPSDPPVLEEGDDSGIYINRFISATLTPGSIFKTVTTAAAIDNLDWESFSYTCSGEREVDGEYVTCMAAHGEQDLEDALANSCNCAFSVITEMLGTDTMNGYVESLGLTKSYDMGGIKNAKGSFVFPDDSPIDLCWAGVGQYNDELNPCSMMIYMGAIANNGKTAIPRMIKNKGILEKLDIDLDISLDESVTIMNSSTANEVKGMMKYTVDNIYGAWSFPDLSVGGKTGTGEVEGREPNATFAGFLDDVDHPYAFVVTVENAASGQGDALPIANAVLQELVYG